MKILLVDDDFFFQKATSFSLLSQGHEVLFASDGQKALGVIGLHQDIDMIICDIDMPVLSGYEFILEMKQVYRGKFPTVIIVSSRSKEDTSIKLPDFEYDHYFEKPVSMQFFDTVLAELNRGEQQ